LGDYWCINFVQARVRFSRKEDVDKALDMDGCLFGKGFGRCCVRVLAEAPEGKKVASSMKEDSATCTNVRVPSQIYSRSEKGSNSDITGNNVTSRDPQPRRPCSVRFNSIVRLDGLPLGTSKEDIQYLLWGTNVAHRDIHLVVDEKSPYALVIFSNSDMASNVVERWNGTVITTKNGSHKILLRLAGKMCDEMSNNSVVKDGVLKMSNLPGKVTPQDIAQFFSSFLVKSKGIHLQSCKDTKKDKMAYIEFQNCESALEAQQLNQTSLGNKFKNKPCSLNHVSRMEMEMDILYSTSHHETRESLCRPSIQGKNGAVHLCNPFPMFQGSSFIDPRYFIHHCIQKHPFPSPPRVHSNSRSRAMYDIDNLPQAQSKVASQARYFVKDLETGKSLYLDQAFAPAGVPSTNGGRLDNTRRPKSSSLDHPETTRKNVSERLQACAHQADDDSRYYQVLKRQSEEMARAESDSAIDTRPNKHQHTQ
jgi:RNA recognition motif-containing protein